MLTRSRLRLVKSPNLLSNSANTALSSEKCRTLPDGCSLSPSVIQKLERLQTLRPHGLAILERLVDDILADIDGTRP